MSHKNQRCNKVGCPDHPNQELIDDYHNGTMVCSACGLVVVDQIIDEGAEWRSFADDTDQIERSRVGGAENRFLSSAGNLATHLDSASGSLNSYGKSVYKQSQVRSVDRALLAAFKNITVMADRINLPMSVIDHACYLYQKMYKQNNYKGNIILKDAKTAACLYIACHKENCPRTSKEICAISELSRKEICDSARVILKTLKTDLGRTKSDDLIPRFCGQLYLPKDVRQQATKIAQEVDKLTTIKSQPESIAAASIYFAAKNLSNYRSQRIIGECVGLTATTISKTYTLINSHLLK